MTYVLIIAGVVLLAIAEIALRIVSINSGE